MLMATTTSAGGREPNRTTKEQCTTKMAQFKLASGQMESAKSQSEDVSLVPGELVEIYRKYCFSNNYNLEAI